MVDYKTILKLNSDFDGDPVAKVYEHWYEQKLFVEYEDLQGSKYQGYIENSSKIRFACGEQIDVCYLIDNPDEVTTKSYKTSTIEDYFLERRFWLILILLAFILLMAIIVSCCIVTV